MTGKPKTIHEALLAFQASPPAFSKEGRGPGYKYAHLQDVLRETLPRLNEHGLTLRWATGVSPEGMIMVEATITHAPSGETLTASLAMPLPTREDCTVMGRDGKPRQTMTPMQMVGSHLTYMRRYSLLAVLGLTDGLDDDAGGGRNTENTRPAATDAEDWSADLGRKFDAREQEDKPSWAREEEDDDLPF